MHAFGPCIHAEAVRRGASRTRLARLQRQSLGRGHCVARCVRSFRRAPAAAALTTGRSSICQRQIFRHPNRACPFVPLLAGASTAVLPSLPSR